MNLLQDIITYVRRIIKTPSNAVVSDELIIDYINRFWIMDVDARMQLFDLKKSYRFQTTPGVDKYNMPLYDVQIHPGSQSIGMYPVYQGFFGPCFVNGVPVSFHTQKEEFDGVWWNVQQNLPQVATGDGTTTNFTFQLPILSNSVPPNPPVQGILRGHVDLAGIMATGNNIDPPLVNNSNAAASIQTVPVTSVNPSVYIISSSSTGENIIVTDSGQFLEGNINYGILMVPGKAPNGNTQVTGGYSTTSNTINYLTGEVNVNFPVPPAAGVNINVQCLYYETGLPRSILYYNNTITLRSPPSQQWLVELQAYLTPAAFLNTGDAIQFGYMAEYLARGAARKMLSDTGDVEQFAFYEPLFKEQELLVWKRSQRQFTATRTQTIYSAGLNQGNGGNTNYGQGTL